ncbi:MAG: exostosin family protein [Cytophagales bacterium]|nr:exostosin family protein [Cytophagales bacterium]
MLKIYPVSDYITEPYQKEQLNNIYDTWRQYSSQSHDFVLVKDENEADIFLFNTHFTSRDEYYLITTHHFYKKYFHKCMLWCDKDVPYPILPGIYTAMPRVPMHHLFFRTVPYLSDTNPVISANNEILPKYMACFQGSMSANVRKNIMKQKYSDSILRISTTPYWGDFIFGKGFADTGSDYLSQYAANMLNAKFILCPKGNGTASYRFFETLQAGRVPVLISDSYVLPAIDENWDDIIITIAENNIRNLEKILLTYENEWQERGKKGKFIYEKYFSKSQKTRYYLLALKQIYDQINKISFLYMIVYKIFAYAYILHSNVSFQLKRTISKTISYIKQKLKWK